MVVNSERCIVSTYTRKYDSARSPADCQSWRTQSVDVVGLGCLVVRMPTRTSGCSTKYVLLAITTAGELLFRQRRPTRQPRRRRASMSILSVFGIQALPSRRSKIAEVFVRP